MLVSSFGDPGDDLAVTVRQAFRHSIYLPHSQVQSMADQPIPRPEASSQLTRRELEILHLVAEGHSNGKLADGQRVIDELLGGLTDRTVCASAIVIQRAFFEKHIVSWMGRMFADMERATSAKFYKSVGTLGQVFMKIEAEAFAFAN